MKEIAFEELQNRRSFLNFPFKDLYEKLLNFKRYLNFAMFFNRCPSPFEILNILSNIKPIEVLVARYSS